VRRDTAIPLVMLKENDTAQVVDIDAGRGLRRRLLAMGFTSGNILRVVRKANGGPIVVCVNETRIVLGRGMAMKIQVVVGDYDLPVCDSCEKKDVCL